MKTVRSNVSSSHSPVVVVVSVELPARPGCSVVETTAMETAVVLALASHHQVSPF